MKDVRMNLKRVAIIDIPFLNVYEDTGAGLACPASQGLTKFQKFSRSKL